MSNAAYLKAAVIRLRGAIFKFRATKVITPFYADELREFVAKEVGFCAPGSADRVLRDLRQSGALNYEVLNRGLSLYRFIPRKP